MTLPPDLTHEYAPVNGIRMHYVRAGRGDETVVLLHGFPEFWRSWRHQVAALSPHFRVIVPDLRGYNETEAAAPYDVGTLQRDVLELIERAGASKVHLAGHDWGGGLAWLIAMNHPEVVKTLTICNAPHPAVFRKGLRRPRQLARSWYWLFFQVPWLPERVIALKSYHILARTLMTDCRPGTFTRDDVKEYLAAWRRQGLGGGINWYRALLRHRDILPAPVPVIEAPTLLIWGERDIALGKELSEGAEPYVRNLRVERLADVSHWVQQEAPEVVNTLMLEHLGAGVSRGE